MSMRRVMLLDRLVERRNCLRHQLCPSFNWKEDGLDSWIILVLVINFALESDVHFLVYRDWLCKHVGKLSVIDFEIIKSEKLVLLNL